MEKLPMPEIVSASEWQRQRDELLVQEKLVTRQLDALAARRRRLPAVEFDANYQFVSATGTKTLLDLFEGRPQLALYQFMDRGPDAFCPGCTYYTNHLMDLEGLADVGVSWATVSDMPIEQIVPYKEKMGWTMPFYSSHGTTFSVDCGGGEGFMLNMFITDGTHVYRTYNTFERGVDLQLFHNNILDLSVYGRQEDWEDSPEGWPQQPTYG
jgi:predicted dithiol-disulfide oxidoreductase (DUF899 family)